MEGVKYLMYKVVATRDFLINLTKLDKSTQILIKKYIDNKIQNSNDLRAKEKPLRYNLSGYWRYRIGDYRLICEIDDKTITIILIDIGHRKNIY